MQKTQEFNASNPNLFRIKPTSKPQLPTEARTASPRGSFLMRTGGSFGSTGGVTSESMLFPKTPVSPGSGLWAQGPFRYTRTERPRLPPL